jgi:hypothetical protein
MVLMKKFFIALVTIAAILGSAFGQKRIAPWPEWTKADAEKILENSAWSQVQIDTDTTEMMYSPTSQSSRGVNSSNRSLQGANNQAISVSYHIRLLSAAPVRQAFARNLLLSTESPSPQLKEQLQSWVDRNYEDYIVIGVTYDSSDGRYLSKARQEFESAITAKIKTNTYIERSDGRRVFLSEYHPPIEDGLGAKFVFSRKVDGQPFLPVERGTFRFYSEMSSSIKLNMRFGVAEMVYNGKIEY